MQTGCGEFGNRHPNSKAHGQLPDCCHLQPGLIFLPGQISLKPMAMKLLNKRTSVSAGEFPKLVKADWPVGRVTLYDDRFVIFAGAEEYTLLFTDIDYLDIKVGQVNFYHHNPDVIKDISLNGFLIPGIIRKAIAQFGLQVQVR